MTVGDSFEKLVGIMHRLRAPGGCPWDGEQTHESIKPYLVEEAYEVLEAIDGGDADELCGELGDVLLQVVFHAEMAAETDRFAIADVIDAICDKMVRRHPHVFGDTKVSDSAEVLRNWSKIKAAEREGSSDRSALAGVPRAMPALLRAHRVGEKASSAGFDWTDIAGVVAKLHEELEEVETAMREEGTERVAEELGDLLFAATSLARHLGVRPEDALDGATDRFDDRYRKMEALLEKRGQEMTSLGDAEKNRLWEEAKSQ